MDRPIPTSGIANIDPASELFYELLALEERKFREGCDALLAYCEQRMRVRDDLLAFGRSVGLISEASSKGVA